MTQDEIEALIPGLATINRVICTNSEPKPGARREAAETVTIAATADLLEALYVSSIKTRLAYIGKDPAEFSLQDRRWGEHVTGKPFIDHYGELYLPVIINEVISEKYFIGPTEYPKSLFVKDKRRNQGLPKELEVAFHNYKIAHIVSIA